MLAEGLTWRRLGDGTTIDHPTPLAVAGPTPFELVSAGANHSCGAGTDAWIYCWGENFSGQLGEGTSAGSPLPVAIVPSDH